MGLLSSPAGVCGARSHLHVCFICGATWTGPRTSEPRLQVLSTNAEVALTPSHWQSLGELEKKQHRSSPRATADCCLV